MMQDYPKSLPKTARVGFTTLEYWAAYSPVKNSPEEARGKAKSGSAPHSASSGELDIYAANCKIMDTVGAKIDAPKTVTYNGVELQQGPAVVWSPSFAVTLS